MKYPLTAVLASVVCLLASCQKYESYADQKENEKKAIERFVKNTHNVLKDKEGKAIVEMTRPIKLISRQEFENKGCVTNLEENEYVDFTTMGLYMQVLDKGSGTEMLRNGETVKMAVRYMEYSIMGDSLQSWNLNTNVPDMMTVTRNDTARYDAQFVYLGTAPGVMQGVYASDFVPLGWLVPLDYITPPGRNPERPSHVRLVVPHMMATTWAHNLVSPMFYELWFTRTE